MPAMATARQRRVVLPTGSGALAEDKRPVVRMGAGG